jgi:hypothetical protein
MMLKPARRMFGYGCFLVLLAGLSALSAQESPGGVPFKVKFGKGGISSLRYAGDKYDTKRGGNWRQPQTSYTLSPKFTPGDELSYMFKFRWADGYDGVRNVLYEEGLLDVNVVPGMTVPEGLDALVSIRSKNPILSVVPEHPGQTQVEKQGEKAKDTQIY